MKLTARKIAAITLFASVTAMAAFTASREQVNLKVKEILSEFNNATTIAGLTFTDLEIDETRTLGFGFKAIFEKLGSKNRLQLHIPSIGYRYDENRPAAKGQVRVEYDLVKALGQEVINEYAKELESLPEGLGKQFLEEYGDAASIETQVAEIIKDQNEQVISARVAVLVKIDLAKLPEGMSAQDVRFLDTTLNFGLSQKGADVDFALTFNPQHASFARNGTGLKEYIQGLLEENPELYAGIGSLVQALDEMATRAVEFEAEK